MTPLRWQSDNWEDLYFERQKDGISWERHDMNRVSNYSQISIESDSNGDLVVTLKKKKSTNLRRLSLTEGMGCERSANFTCGENYFYFMATGYWVRKDGMKINF